MVERLGPPVLNTRHERIRLEPLVPNTFVIVYQRHNSSNNSSNDFGDLFTVSILAPVLRIPFTRPSIGT